MKKIFRYLHRQPKHVRDGYAFAAASVFTGIVFMFWVVSFPGLGGVVGNQAPAATKEGSSAFATLLKQSKEQLAQLRSSTATDEGDEAETTSSTTGEAEIILSPEDIAKAQHDLQKGNDYTSNFPTEVFEEVMIATSSAKAITNQEVSSTTEPVTAAE